MMRRPGGEARSGGERRPGGPGMRMGAGMRGGMRMGARMPMERSKDFWGSLRRLLGRLRPERLKVVMALLFGLASVGFTVSGPKSSVTPPTSCSTA